MFLLAIQAVSLLAKHVGQDGIDAAVSCQSYPDNNRHIAVSQIVVCLRSVCAPAVIKAALIKYGKASSLTRR